MGVGPRGLQLLEGYWEGSVKQALVYLVWHYFYLLNYCYS